MAGGLDQIKDKDRLEVFECRHGKFRAVYANGRLVHADESPFPAEKLAELVLARPGARLTLYEKRFISGPWFEKGRNVYANGMPERFEDVELDADMPTEIRKGVFDIELAQALKKHVDDGLKLDVYLSNSETYKIVQYTLDLLDNPIQIRAYDTSD